MSFAPADQGRTGYLLKKGRINTDWKMRFFVQHAAKVSYFLSEEKMMGGAKAFGQILLEQSVVRPCTEDVGKDFCFEVITKDRVYRLVAASHEDMIDWITSLVPFTLLHAENEWIKRAEKEITVASVERGNAFESAVVPLYTPPNTEEIITTFSFDHIYNRTASSASPSPSQSSPSPSPSSST